MSDRQKLFYALLVSAFFHIALGLVLASWTVEHGSDVAKALPALSQLTVTIMPQRQPAPVPVKPAPVILAAPTPLPANLSRPVLDSDGLTRSAKAPAHPVFQSDANMVAGSRLPATGNLPLPTEAGPARKFQDFADRPGSFGKGRTPIDANPAHPSSPSMPSQSPSAITEVQRSATPAPQGRSTPAPAPVARATPAPTPKPVPTAAPDTLALGTPTPTPAPPAQLPTPIEQLARLNAPPSLRGNAEIAPMTPPPEAPPAPPSSGHPEPSMQRETTRTRIDGGIRAHGPDGVDAVETPFGRYHHRLYNLIGSRWKLYLQEHPQDVGDVTILVELNPNGRVAATRVVNNHALDGLADISTRAIMESELPPVPDDLAPMLRDGKLEISFSFSVYDPHNDDASSR